MSWVKWNFWEVVGHCKVLFTYLLENLKLYELFNCRTHSRRCWAFKFFLWTLFRHYTRPFQGTFEFFFKTINIFGISLTPFSGHCLSLVDTTFNTKHFLDTVWLCQVVIKYCDFEVFLYIFYEILDTSRQR